MKGAVPLNRLKYFKIRHVFYFFYGIVSSSSESNSKMRAKSGPGKSQLLFIASVSFLHLNLILFRVFLLTLKIYE